MHFGMNYKLASDCENGAVCRFHNKELSQIVFLLTGSRNISLKLFSPDKEVRSQNVLSQKQI